MVGEGKSGPAGTFLAGRAAGGRGPPLGISLQGTLLLGEKGEAELPQGRQLVCVVVGEGRGCKGGVTSVPNTNPVSL